MDDATAAWNGLNIGPKLEPRQVRSGVFKNLIDYTIGFGETTSEAAVKTTNALGDFVRNNWPKLNYNIEVTGAPNRMYFPDLVDTSQGDGSMLAILFGNAEYVENTADIPSYPQPAGPTKAGMLAVGGPNKFKPSVIIGGERRTQFARTLVREVPDAPRVLKFTGSLLTSAPISIVTRARGIGMDISNLVAMDGPITRIKALVNGFTYEGLPGPDSWAYSVVVTVQRYRRGKRIFEKSQIVASVGPLGVTNGATRTLTLEGSTLIDTANEQTFTLPNTSGLPDSAFNNQNPLLQVAAPRTAILRDAKEDDIVVAFMSLTFSGVSPTAEPSENNSIVSFGNVEFDFEPQQAWRAAPVTTSQWAQSPLGLVKDIYGKNLAGTFYS
jgi:hypothetical protein